MSLSQEYNRITHLTNNTSVRDYHYLLNKAHWGRYGTNLSTKYNLGFLLSMPLFIIGLGLWDEKDISLRGLEAVKSSELVYLESYTSILLCNQSRLEALYGRPIICADRKTVEQDCETMLDYAKSKDVAFLVAGDPFCATTHMDLVLRAKELKIEVKVIHNASVMNAVAACGLQLYLFGETVSIPFFLDSWCPDSFYTKIKKNLSNGLHTLCLLDIKVKEQTTENMMRENDIYEPPRFMTVNEAIAQLFQIEEKRKENVCVKDTKAFGIARLGSLESQHIQSGTLQELINHTFGEPLHSLVICAPVLHNIEEEFFKLHKIF